jgi:hypothetical protein
MFLYEEGDWERRLRGWCRVGGGGEADLRFMTAGGGWLAGSGLVLGLAFPLCGKKEVMCFNGDLLWLHAIYITFRGGDIHSMLKIS